MWTTLMLAQMRSGEKMAVAILPLALLVVLVILPVIWNRQRRRKARRMGYASVRAYLRAVPKNDEEKRDAVDMVAKGVVLCVLGALLPPLVILGLFPLYYGGRKLLLVGFGVAPAMLAMPGPGLSEPVP